MKKIKIEMEGRNNFHNAGSVNIRITGETVPDESGRSLYVISLGQAHRLNNHFCGILGCTCGSGPVVEWDHGQYGISTSGVEG